MEETDLLKVIINCFTCGELDIICWILYIIAGTFIAFISKVNSGEQYFSLMKIFKNKKSVEIHFLWIYFIDFVVNLIFAFIFVTQVYLKDKTIYIPLDVLIGSAIMVYFLSSAQILIKKEAMNVINTFDK